VSGELVTEPLEAATEALSAADAPAATTTASRIASWLGPGGPLRAFLAELLLIGVLLAVYQLVRHLAGGHPEAAARHAHDVWHAERSVLLPDEADVQRWGLRWRPAARLANLYYVGVHFPGTALAMLWLWLRDRVGYLRMRTELVLLTGSGLVLHVLFPLAPPRLMPGFGTRDTMLAVGPSAYPSDTGGYANQFAAMPSLHVGWALLVAVAVIRTTRGRLRWLALLHPVLTLAVVVVTANHYWLDALAATALLGAAVYIVGRGRTAARTALNRAG
jgi:hypothetical protein